MVKLKNHVSPKAKRIKAILKGKYGLSLDDLNMAFEQAIKGDTTKLQAIGEVAREARLSRELMPMLKEAYIDVIKGTAEYNQAMSEILVEGSKSAIAIDKAVMKATLENQAYANNRRELAAEFVTSKNAESKRHQYQMNYIQIRGYIDQFMSQVDRDATLLGQTNRPEVKQVQADAAYTLEVAKHVLAEGDNSRVDLITKKDYTPSGIQEILIKLKSALGF
jgi:hypothetical protein